MLNRKIKAVVNFNLPHTTFHPSLGDCPAQLAPIFMILHLYLCFMINIKVTNMKNTAGKSASSHRVSPSLFLHGCW